MTSRSQSFIVYFVLIVAIAAMLYMGFRQDSTTEKPLTINEVAQLVKDGKVKRIVIESDDAIRVVTSTGTETGVESHKEPNATLVDQLISLGVTAEQLSTDNIQIEVKPPSQWTGLISGALYILPVIFMVGVLWFIFRQAQGSNNAAMSFGKS
ncbi:MAG TPA: ATP-dependent metallopeptidase FtsH/Yme1/Tma family protein, partial [Anaerolineales bacterium]